MKRITIVLLFVLLGVIGCSHKEENKITTKGFIKKAEKEDIELKKWIKALEEKPYKISIQKLKNPFVSPEILKLVTARKEKISLELVGILEKNGERIALLQDNTKKGYIVKTGNRIGNIAILEIGLDYVLIEEEEINIYGEKEKNKRILYLKKE